MELAAALVEVSEDAGPLVNALVDGFAAKQPKVITGCAQLAARLVANFGPTVIDAKQLLKVKNDCGMRMSGS